MFLKYTLILFSFNVFAVERSQNETAADKSLFEKKEESKTLTLGLVDGESDDLSSVVTARFNLNLSTETPQIEDHGTFLQVKLPGVLIPESGKFVDVKSPYITKIASFQVNENTGALRLFLNTDAAVVKLATKAEVLGDRLLISVDHNKLAQLIVKPTEEKASAEQFVKTAAVKSDILDQEKKLEAKKELGVGSSLQTLQLGEKMTMATVFSGVMMAGFLMILTIKRLRRKKFSFEDAEEEQASVPVKMKLLSSMAVVGKQRLSLVQVGDQQILLSVSPESISYIATIPKKGQTFTEHLVAENMQAANVPNNSRLKAPQPPQQPQLTQTIPVRQSMPAPRASVPTNKIAAPKPTDPSVTGNLAANSQYEDISRAIRERLKKLPHI